MKCIRSIMNVNQKFIFFRVKCIQCSPPWPLGNALLQPGAMWELWGASSSLAFSFSWLLSLHINGTRTGMCLLWEALPHVVKETALAEKGLLWVPVHLDLSVFSSLKLLPVLSAFPSCLCLLWLCGACVSLCVDHVWLSVDHVWLIVWPLCDWLAVWNMCICNLGMLHLGPPSYKVKKPKKPQIPWSMRFFCEEWDEIVLFLKKKKNCLHFPRHNVPLFDNILCCPAGRSCLACKTIYSLVPWKQSSHPRPRGKSC